MSGIALEHPLIRRYLRELDAAFAGSPAGTARELREQITAHLEDTLPAGASDQEVTDALARLGSPASLAAEASAGAPAPSPAAQARHRIRAALARRTWRFWSITAAAVILAGSVTGYVTSAQTASVLLLGPEQGWWYQQDQAHDVTTNADDAEQDTVPIRVGQRQGRYLVIYNPSDWTQTVLGPDDRSAQSPGAPFAQFGLSRSGLTYDDYSGDPRSARYRSLPAEIPPHQSRALRILWTSTYCMQKGAENILDQVVLRVRIGWITRTETILLHQAYALAGTARSQDCAP